MVYASWTDLTGAAGCTSAANEPGIERRLDLQDAHLVLPLDRRRHHLVRAA